MTYEHIYLRKEVRENAIFGETVTRFFFFVSFGHFFDSNPINVLQASSRTFTLIAYKSKNQSNFDARSFEHIRFESSRNFHLPFWFKITLLLLERFERDGRFIPTR